MVSSVSYSVSISLEELENSLHSEVLNKIRSALHVESLKQAHIQVNSVCGDFTFFTIGENK